MGVLQTRSSKLGGNLAEGFGNQRGETIDSLFLESEKCALTDWVKTRKQLSKEELACLEPDIVLRTVRSSLAFPLPNRRIERNTQLLKARVAWFVEFKVAKIQTFLSLLRFNNSAHNLFNSSLYHEYTEASFLQSKEKKLYTKTSTDETTVAEPDTTRRVPNFCLQCSKAREETKVHAISCTHLRSNTSARNLPIPVRINNQGKQGLDLLEHHHSRKRERLESSPFSFKSFQVHYTKVPLKKIEEYRDLVMPLKIYCSKTHTASKIPIVKLKIQETNWFTARKTFTEVELKFLTVFLMESLLNKIRFSGCTAETSDPNVFVHGKFILILDLEGLSLSHVYNAYSLGLRNCLLMISKFYPNLLHKFYLVHRRKRTLNMVLPILKVFLSKITFERLQLCNDESECYESLTIKDAIGKNQIPVEFGGSFEGQYVIEV